MNSIKQDPSLYRLVVAHYLVSAVCFLALALMIAFSGEVFTGHYFQPKLLAITHMAALGWGTLIIFGASYQLLPVVLETTLFSKKLGWISFALFVPGLIDLVWAFWQFDPGLHMQCGAVLVLSGILLFTINVILTGRQNSQDSLQQEFIVTAAIWLLFTAVLGLLMVFNFQYAFLPKDHLHFLKLHAHMGLAGWFLLLIIGVSSRLIPMFLVSSYKGTRLLSLSYYLINGALILFLADTYISGINWKTLLWGLAGISGIISYGLFVRKCYLSRIRKSLDFPMMNTILSVIILLLAVLVMPFIVYFHLKGDPSAVRLSVLYGSFLVMGWISALILGQTFKTLPFIVWVKHYEHLSGKVKTPLPSDLFNERWLKFQTWAFIIFCASFYSGILFSIQNLILAGVVFLLIAAILFVSNVLKILLHQTKTTGYGRV